MDHRLLLFTRHPIILFLLTLLLLSQAIIANALDPRPINDNETAQLVIVMDDLGNNLATGRRAIDLPGALTYAILPHTPAAHKLAFYAASVAKGKEVIIHMPMEAKDAKGSHPKGLETSLDRKSFVLKLHEAIEQVPFAKGLSNHMGSRLTQLTDQMQWLMVELEKRDLYFVDSKTTGKSVAMAAAHRQQVPYLARDIFLDHDPNPKAINRAFNNAVKLAQQTGVAVLICHPYPTTLTFLEKKLPQLDKNTISLATVSTILSQFDRASLSTKGGSLELSALATD